MLVFTCVALIVIGVGVGLVIGMNKQPPQGGGLQGQGTFSDCSTPRDFADLSEPNVRPEAPAGGSHRRSVSEPPAFNIGSAPGYSEANKCYYSASGILFAKIQEDGLPQLPMPGAQGPAPSFCQLSAAEPEGPEPNRFGPLRGLQRFFLSARPDRPRAGEQEAAEPGQSARSTVAGMASMVGSSMSAPRRPSRGAMRAPQPVDQQVQRNLGLLHMAEDPYSLHMPPSDIGMPRRYSLPGFALPQHHHPVLLHNIQMMPSSTVLQVGSPPLNSPPRMPPAYRVSSASARA